MLSFPLATNDIKLSFEFLMEFFCRMKRLPRNTLMSEINMGTLPMIHYIWNDTLQRGIHIRVRPKVFFGWRRIYTGQKKLWFGLSRCRSRKFSIFYIHALKLNRKTMPINRPNPNSYTLLCGSLLLVSPSHKCAIIVPMHCRKMELVINTLLVPCI